MLLDQVATFTINYSGAPFNTPLKENKPFYYALLGGACFFWVLTAEILPELNESLQLVPVPPEFRSRFVLQVALFRSVNVCSTNFCKEPVIRYRECPWSVSQVDSIIHGSAGLWPLLAHRVDSKVHLQTQTY